MGRNTTLTPGPKQDQQTGTKISKEEHGKTDKLWELSSRQPPEHTTADPSYDDRNSPETLNTHCLQ